MCVCVCMCVYVSVRLFASLNFNMACFFVTKHTHRNVVQTFTNDLSLLDIARIYRAVHHTHTHTHIYIYTTTYTHTHTHIQIIQPQKKQKSLTIFNAYNTYTHIHIHTQTYIHTPKKNNIQRTKKQHTQHTIHNIQNGSGRFTLHSLKRLFTHTHILPTHTHRLYTHISFATQTHERELLHTIVTEYHFQRQFSIFARANRMYTHTAAGTIEHICVSYIHRQIHTHTCTCVNHVITST